jgi:hypothetical protein
MQLGSSTVVPFAQSVRRPGRESFFDGRRGPFINKVDKFYQRNGIDMGVAVI